MAIRSYESVVALLAIGWQTVTVNKKGIEDRECRVTPSSGAPVFISPTPSPISSY